MREDRESRGGRITAARTGTGKQAATLGPARNERGASEGAAVGEQGLAWPEVEKESRGESSKDGERTTNATEGDRTSRGARNEEKRERRWREKLWPEKRACECFAERRGRAIPIGGRRERTLSREAGSRRG